MQQLVSVSKGASPPNILFAEHSGLLFRVLPPQRRFKWKKQQVKQLWDDIIAAYHANRESYFLGTLLLVQSDGGDWASVIDGQQRITTISLLLAVLRDYCKGFTDLSTRADNIQKLISRVDGDGRPTGSLVVTLQEPDNTDFTKLVREPNSTTSLPPQKGLLGKAVALLANSVQDHIEEHDRASDREESLRSLCEFVQSRVLLIPLEVQNESEGYLVFDTTNTRGMRLSPSEALKGRLAIVAREDADLSEALIKTWNGVANNLEASGLRIDAMDDYLHAILCWRENYTTKRSLDRIASGLSSSNELRDFVKEFVRDLENYSQSYLAVVAPTERSALSEDLRDLGSLNVQSQSFLTMAHRHSHNRFERAVSLVLSLQIRNVTVGRFQANEYEKDWPKWARMARQGNIDRALAEIQHHLVGDEEFLSAFESAEVSSADIVRHLLRKLDPIARPRSGVQPMEVDVEHVMPKSLVKKLIEDKDITPNVERWIEDLGHEVPENPEEKLVLGRKFELLLNRLGNQTLLDNKENRVAKDRPFLEKRDYYARQALKLTLSLSECERWGESQILNRQRELAKMALLVWPK